MSKIDIQINSLQTVDEIPGYWTTEDYKALLEAFDFPEAENVKDENLLEYLKMAIGEEEPPAAAAVLLTYKLSDSLSEGQIDQISNDMLLDKISEEYPEIDLHPHLFSINQLLYKAYNGKFPNTDATVLECTINADGDFDIEDKTLFLKALAQGLSERSIIKRLFSEQLEDGNEFPEAEHILWELSRTGDGKVRIVTSDYWIGPEDFAEAEYEANLETA
ncbi:MAG: hypothetical protein ABR574_12495 [Cryomorphaceae bacterium]